MQTMRSVCVCVASAVVVCAYLWECVIHDFACTADPRNALCYLKIQRRRGRVSPRGAWKLSLLFYQGHFRLGAFAW